MQQLSLRNFTKNTQYCIKFLLIFVSSFSTLAQTSPLYQYEYLFPVNPKNPTILSGGVGEIRFSHFHAGIDIPALTGTKVYAAADGYVYMLRPSTRGYGNFVFLMHPESQQRTLYAHLDAFAEPLASYVKQKQYENEKFDLDIFPPKNLLSVKKGDLIGYIGNTGASAGAHLHYEIRTLDDIALNPLLFPNITEVNDKIPPLFTKIAFQPLSQESMINDSWEKAIFTPQKITANVYELKEVPKVYGTFGIETLTYDLVDYSGFSCGTNKLKLLLESEEVFSYNLHQIPHAYNRCMNVHLDYVTYRQNFQALQRCYVVDGNRLGAYQTNPKKGKITIKENKIYNFELQAEDAAGNITLLKGKIQGYIPTKKPKFQLHYSPYKSYISHQIKENILQINYHYPKKSIDTIGISLSGIWVKVPCKEHQAQKSMYLWDLRKGLPNYAEVGEEPRYPLFFTWLIPSQQDFMYQEDEDLAIRFEPNTLFDTLYLELKRDKHSLQIGNNMQPIFQHYQVAWKMKAPSLPASQWGVYYQEGNAFYYQESTWHGDSAVVFRSNSLGNFVLMKDETPPTIKLANKSKKQVAFYISDNLSGIESYRATLNGEFLLMKYEHKQAYIWSETKQEGQILEGKLVLEVKDKAGNTQKFETTL